MGIFEPEDKREDYLAEAYERELDMQQRMFDEADLHRQEYQKLLFKHTKLEVEHRSSLNEISLLRRLVRALYDQDRVAENEVRKEMEKEYVNFR